MCLFVCFSLIVRASDDTVMVSLFAFDEPDNEEELLEEELYLHILLLCGEKNCHCVFSVCVSLLRADGGSAGWL